MSNPMNIVNSWCFINSKHKIIKFKPEKKIEVSDFVLTNFTEEEKVDLEKVIQDIIDSMPILIDKKLDLFSSTVNNK